MKKTIIVSLLMLLSTIAYCQITGIDFSKAKTVSSDSQMQQEVLLKIDEGYVIDYDLTPVGLKHCMDKLGDIMWQNDFNYDNASRNDILLASYVESILDYQDLCTSIRVGSSEVLLGWEKNGWLVQLTLTENIFGILFVKLKR